MQKARKQFTCGPSRAGTKPRYLEAALS